MKQLNLIVKIKNMFNVDWNQGKIVVCNKNNTIFPSFH